MTAKQLNEIKKILLAKKEDLLKVVRDKKDQELQEKEVGDEVDAAVDSEEKELLFGLTDNEKGLLASIDSALRKIEMKKYGVCEGCASKIPFERLKAMPYANYCIKCQPKFEKNK
ncbi:MAG: TraR/DksA family transcriptional regulator [Elusimicrobia bacterium]|nr:TraR/DksA family transcriptional regulator [Elusimicrobiota bacterium]